MNDKKYIIVVIALVIVLACLIGNFMKDSNSSNLSGTSSNNSSSNTSNSNNTTLETLTKSDLFSERDLKQTIDTTDATKYTVSTGKNITIKEEGIYVISGTANDVTIYVEAGDEDKVQIVLDGVNITNTDSPVIYAKSGDKIFVTTTKDSSLSVTGTFKADGNTNLDGVIFSKSDVTLNGTTSLTIESTKNGIVSKDEVKITGGSYNITADSKCIEANDGIAIADGTFNLTAGTDGLHAEYDEDDTVGYVYIADGKFTINVGDDGIHATTIVQIDDGELTIKAAEGIEGTIIKINGGTITINASDDGINAASKSKSYSPYVEINGGEIKVTMGQGDTDGIDSNGDITINGGTVDVTGSSTFDYDGNGTINGGTVIVNGEKVTTLPNQMMGGPGGIGGNHGQRR